MTDCGKKGHGSKKRQIFGALFSAFTALAIAAGFVFGEDLAFGDFGPWLWMAVIPAITGVATAIFGVSQGEEAAMDGDAADDVHASIEKKIAEIDQAVADWHVSPIGRRWRIAGPLMFLVAAVTGLSITLITGETLLDLPRSWWLIGMAGITAISAARLMIVLRD